MRQTPSHQRFITYSPPYSSLPLLDQSFVVLLRTTESKCRLTILLDHSLNQVTGCRIISIK